MTVISQFVSMEEMVEELLKPPSSAPAKATPVVCLLIQILTATTQVPNTLLNYLVLLHLVRWPLVL